VLDVGLGDAERNGRAGVLVSLEASFSPARLPRHRPVPVTLTLTGTISTADASPGTHLGSLELAFGARGGLSTAGLPRCRGAQLRNATQRQALARCRGALVGSGTILTDVLLDPEKPVPAHAGVLAFNGTAGGRPAVWIHAYSASPPVSFALPFSLRRPNDGAYGVSLETPVSSTLGRWLRLRSFRITIGRRYRVNGVQRSYLSASCPLPPRLTIGFFPLARATYHFVPAPTLTTTVLRSCRARD
jgi:hypothetical protein